MVAVCKSCKSLSASTDRDPALIGKVAELVDTGSPVTVGIKGKYAGRPFSLVGRVQLGHPLGGVWDEWYLAFEDGAGGGVPPSRSDGPKGARQDGARDDGRWGWLAEAQGRHYLTFETVLDVAPPAQGQLDAGMALELGKAGRWTVVERSSGTFVSAEGEIPWLVEPGKTYPFADLSGPHGAFATLDYGELPPTFYSGREQTLDDLGIKGPSAAPGKVKALSLNCPNCASPLSLRAPDKSLRVACPSCGALMDCEGGKLRFLQSLDQSPAGILLPTGTEGMLKGVPYVCIGAMRRSCTVEGTNYPWSEYLLMDKRGGFKWLTESDGHWSFVETIPAGELHPAGIANMAVGFKGRTFRRFQDVSARVDAVFGEFSWKVNQGEKVEVTEYVDAPQSLAKETQTHPGGGEEVNWSLSTYLDPQLVWTGFKLAGAPPPARGIAPHMPNPHKATLSQMAMWIVAALGLLLVTVMLASIRNREALLLRKSFDLPTFQAQTFSRKPPRKALRPPPGTPDPAAPPETPEPVFFEGPILIPDGTHNLALDLSAAVDQAWLGVEGALVSEETGVVEQFEVSASWYHGVDGGESWTEGSKKARVLLSALPKGSYMLRLAPAWEGPRPPVPSFTVELRRGVAHWVYAWIVLAAILFWPLIQLFRVLSFEGRRWSESMYSQGNATVSGGDD